STCFSSAESSLSCSENELRICARLSTSGLISSRIRIRSVFLAQPGNGSFARLRASRTRLLITIGWCPPSPDNQSPRVLRIVLIFILLLFLKLELSDFVPDRRRRFVILF